MTLPFAPAAERNAAPILIALRDELGDADRVLEIGAGTGQHAVHVTSALPGVRWLPTERPERLAELRPRVVDAGAPNGIEPPLPLDVLEGPWPTGPFDACFAANVLHIMPVDAVEALFRGAGACLRDNGALCLYGPVSIGGGCTSEGNRAFDASLRAGDPDRGIRDLETLEGFAVGAGLARTRIERLPANNHFMVWRRRG